MAAKAQQVVEIYIPCEAGYEDVAVASAATVARKMGFAEAEVGGLQMAVGKACLNAIERGHASAAEIKVLVVLTAAGSKAKVSVVEAGALKSEPGPNDVQIIIHLER